MLPRTALTPAALLGVGLLVAAAVAAIASGPRPLLLGIAALGVVVTVVAGYDGATVQERDLATVLGPVVVPCSAAALVRGRVATAVLVAGALLAGPARALVYQPFLDADCSGCAPGDLALRSMPTLADVLSAVGLVVSMLGAAWALRGTPRPEAVPLVLLLVLMPFAAFGPARVPVVVIACTVATADVARRAYTAYARQSQLDRLVRHLETGGDIEPTALAELAGASDPVARLVVENHRLTRELTERLAAVTQARAGVVRVAEMERRALERDLHDGVQQQLLALGFDLRLALADHPDDPRLLEALAETAASLEDVRRITHGVYPPLLATRGLAAAAAHHVRVTSSATRLQVPAQRTDPTVERAAFAVLADAVARGAADVRVRQDGPMRIEADGLDAFDTHLVDVVGALGGSIVLEGRTLRVVLPCG